MYFNSQGVTTSITINHQVTLLQQTMDLVQIDLDTDQKCIHLLHKISDNLRIQQLLLAYLDTDLSSLIDRIMLKKKLDLLEIGY